MSRTTSEPIEANETSKESENSELTIIGTHSNKNGITKSKHNSVHTGPIAPAITKKVRCFSKSTNIINLSKYKLTNDEEKLLNKGLNFIPTLSREHSSHILQDYLLFDRKLRLLYIFID